MGGVVLLLWGLHMVRSGIMRAFGSGLRRFLGTVLQNRFLALLVGVGVTALLQSSTATGLLMTSFAARGLIELVPGLAVMLGANIKGLVIGSWIFPGGDECRLVQMCSHLPMPIAGFGSSDCATCRSHLLQWSNGRALLLPDADFFPLVPK